MAENLLQPSYGLNNSKLSKATAGTGDVLSGKTFYAGDKTLKTGTFNLGNANATPDKVLDGASFYSNNNSSLQWGTIWPYSSRTWAESVSVTSDCIYARIPTGAYMQKESSGYPEIMIPTSNLPNVTVVGFSGTASLQPYCSIVRYNAGALPEYEYHYSLGGDYDDGRLRIHWDGTLNVWTWILYAASDVWVSKNKDWSYFVSSGSEIARLKNSDLGHYFSISNIQLY